jgi:hypothetical protein
MPAELVRARPQSPPSIVPRSVALPQSAGEHGNHGGHRPEMPTSGSAFFTLRRTWRNVNRTRGCGSAWDSPVVAGGPAAHSSPSPPQPLSSIRRRHHPRVTKVGGWCAVVAVSKQSTHVGGGLVGSTGAPESSGGNPPGNRGGHARTRRQATGAVLSRRTLLGGRRLRLESLHLDRARNRVVLPARLRPHTRGPAQRRGVRPGRGGVLPDVGDR